MRGLSFTAGGELFAVDVTLVQKVARNMSVTPVPTAPDTVVGITNMKGRIVTILSLAALLGRSRDKAQHAHAVIFKPFTEGNDQMGLLIDKPGALIDISEDQILPPPITAGNDGELYISGIGEVDRELYRVINVDLIFNQFIYGSENPVAAMSQEGIDGEGNA